MKTSLLPWLAGALLIGGCVTAPTSPAVVRTGDPVVDGKNLLAQAPARDKVLWEYRTALVALRQGGYADAKTMFDDALRSIEGIYGKDNNAKRARGLFHEESRKTFLGEPYERVMAYYYRGILYWMDGEPDNARACFRSAQLQDSDTQNKEYASDYLLLDYLDGLATVKLGGDGSDAFKRAQSEAKLDAPPAYNPQANVLIFLEFGNGPVKYATGQYREQLRFRGGAAQAQLAVVKIGTQTLRVRPSDDLLFQATTRGGRVMDHVLANKAVFKTSTDVAGDVALVSGLVLAQNRQTQEAGLGLAAAGLLSKLLSASTTPVADTRTWDNLPQFLGFAAFQLPPGQHTATVEFQDGSARPLANLTKTITFTAAAGRDTVLFISDKQTNPKPL